MAKSDIISARLDLIAARARVLADQYKNNQLWDGELTDGLNEIQRELTAVRNNSNGDSGWATSSRGWEPGDR